MVGRPVALVLLAHAIAVFELGLTSGVASAQSRKPLSYFHLHPCALITRAQVAAVYGVTMNPGQSQPSAYGGSCNYTTSSIAASAENKNLSFGFQAGTVASVKSSLFGKLTRVRLLGRTAYCNTQNTLYIDAGSSGGGAFNLSIASDTCGDATKLVRLALARIS